MNLDWKLFLMILLEIVVITSLSILVGSMLFHFSPGMNEFLRVLVSLAGGYILSYVLFFIFGIIIGLVAQTVMSVDELQEFYSKNSELLKKTNSQIEETSTEEDSIEEEQIAVLSADLEEISENKIGTYLDKDIPEWIKVNGEKYIFSHVLMKNGSGNFMLYEADLETSDVIYPPGIVFKKAT